VGPRVGLDVVERRKILRLPGLEFRPLGILAQGWKSVRVIVWNKHDRRELCGAWVYQEVQWTGDTCQTVIFRFKECNKNHRQPVFLDPEDGSSVRLRKVTDTAHSAWCKEPRAEVTFASC
jgi:hypothetical protein